MILAMALFLIPEPALATRRRLPDCWIAAQQVERCHGHVASLKDMRSHRGHEDGRWDLWIGQTQEYESMWAALAAAEEDLHGPILRQRLEVYRKLVGEQRYFRHWAPPQLPEPAPEPEPRPWFLLAGS